MVTIDWNPDNAKLKQFGWISLAGFGLIGAILGLKFAWFAAERWVPLAVFWGIGIGSALLSVIRPSLLKPLYLALTAISAVIGPVVANLVLGLIFLLVFLPIGLVFRLVGRDGLGLRLDPGAESYWSPKPPPQQPARYFRQF